MLFLDTLFHFILFDLSADRHNFCFPPLLDFSQLTYATIIVPIITSNITIIFNIVICAHLLPRKPTILFILFTPIVIYISFRLLFITISFDSYITYFKFRSLAFFAPSACGQISHASTPSASITMPYFNT